jgi:hypothetical protein
LWKKKSQLPDSLLKPMAEANEPKKETVRIKLPPRHAGDASNSNNPKRETVRINLPPRTPNNFAGGAVTPKPPSAPVLPGLGQASKPPSFPLPSIAESAPSSVHSPSIAEELAEAPIAAPLSPGPKKETARIVTLPESRASSPTVKMSKTQPLITAPEPMTQTAPIFVEPAVATNPIEAIPVPLCWMLAGLSALLFIIQLWIYLS